MRLSTVVFCFCGLVWATTLAQQEANLPKTPPEISAKSFELLHTRLDLQFEVSEKWVHANASITMRPYFYETSQVDLDAKNMEIQNIRLAEKSLDFHYDGTKIHLDLDRVYKRTDTLYLQISYRIKLQKSSSKYALWRGMTEGMVCSEEEGSGIKIWTSNNPHSWVPTLADWRQKSSLEVFLTVPDAYTTVSNGTLVAQSRRSDGSRVDRWQLVEKSTPFHFFIALGKFTTLREVYREKPVNSFVDEACQKAAKKVFGKTADMIDFYSKITGTAYPWDAYQQVLVPSVDPAVGTFTGLSVFPETFWPVKGGLTDVNPLELRMANQLFYQWFGAFVTPKSKNELLWSKGFSKYAEVLWIEASQGKDFAEAHLQEMAAQYKSRQNAQNFTLAKPEGISDGDDEAGMIGKTAWALHMLKNLLGAEGFYKGLQHFLHSNAQGTAGILELQQAFETVTGLELNWFFQQWFFKAHHPSVKVSSDYNLLEKTVTVNLKQPEDFFVFPLEITLHEKGTKTVQNVFVNERETSFTFSYQELPDWVQVNSDHVVLGDFTENKTLRIYRYQYRNAQHVADRKEALLVLAKHQEDKEVFKLLVRALEDPFPALQVLALEQIDLRYKYSKREVIKKIEDLAKHANNPRVKAAAVKVLGKLVYFDYESFFKICVKDPSNLVKANALEALYYLNPETALKKAKSLPSNVREALAVPLTNMYINAREEREMAFVAKYLIQGMYLGKDETLKNRYKNAFLWVARSENVKAIAHLIEDLVKKGKQYRTYDFHLEAIRLLREIVREQDKKGHSKQKEINVLVNIALSELID